MEIKTFIYVKYSFEKKDISYWLLLVGKYIVCIPNDK